MPTTELFYTSAILCLIFLNFIYGMSIEKTNIGGALNPIQLTHLPLVLDVRNVSTIEIRARKKPNIKVQSPLNQRPIIGILAQEMSKSLADAYANFTYNSYISASYVKFIESGGARVVPVMINQSDDYYKAIFNYTNGLLIPGGSVSLFDSGYAKAGKKLFELAVKAKDESGDDWPIWGTCLGFELLVLLAANNQPNLKPCNSQDQPLPLNATKDFEYSRIGESAPYEIANILTNENVTANFHKWCLTPENFTMLGMGEFWKLLATGRDWDGMEFVALVEAKEYSVWGSQYHPEKNPYEWTPKYPSLPHNRNAITSSNFQAEFFVDQCRKNLHSFPSRDEEEKHLIYNFNPEYTGRRSIDWVMQQSYMF